MDCSENLVEVNPIGDAANAECQDDQKASDIGGFAEVAGLHKLKSSEKQVLPWMFHSMLHSIFLSLTYSLIR